MGFLDRQLADERDAARSAQVDAAALAAASRSAAAARVTAFVYALRRQLPTAQVSGFWSDQLFVDHPSHSTMNGANVLRPNGYPPWVGAFAVIDDLVVRPAVFRPIATPRTTMFGLGTRYKMVLDSRSPVVGFADDAAWGPQSHAESWGVCLQTGIYRRYSSSWQGEQYPGNFIALLAISEVTMDSLASALRPGSGEGLHSLLRWVLGEAVESNGEHYATPQRIC